MEECNVREGRVVFSCRDLFKSRCHENIAGLFHSPLCLSPQPFSSIPLYL